MTALLCPEIEQFRTSGFVVRRGVLDATALSRELDRALASGRRAQRGGGVADFEYVPMMAARTPLSLALLDRFQAEAALLVGRPVIPLRAKGVRYFGSTRWHTDSSDTVVTSVGFAAYLEPLTAETGALRVVPGSHQGERAARREDGVALTTEPGDVIAFDEHLMHSSSGGAVRRQWRADFFGAPATQREEAAVRAYLARVFPPDWDGGYDVDQFPSYGPDWLASARPAVETLRRLGAYELASAQESFVRSRDRDVGG